MEKNGTYVTGANSDIPVITIYINKMIPTKIDCQIGTENKIKLCLWETSLKYNFITLYLMVRKSKLFY